ESAFERRLPSSRTISSSRKTGTTAPICGTVGTSLWIAACPSGSPCASLLDASRWRWLRSRSMLGSPMARFLRIPSPRLRGALLAATIACAAFVFRNRGGQAVDWSFPYFSGAANFALHEWRVSPAEYAAVRDMDPGDYRAHRHQRSADTIRYTYQNYGYVW